MIVGRQLTSTSTSTSAPAASTVDSIAVAIGSSTSPRPPVTSTVGAARQRARRQRRRARALGVEAVRRAAALRRARRRRASSAARCAAAARRRRPTSASPAASRRAEAVVGDRRQQRRRGAEPGAAAGHVVRRPARRGLDRPIAGDDEVDERLPGDDDHGRHVGTSPTGPAVWNGPLRGSLDGYACAASAVRSTQMDGDPMDTLSDAIRRLQADGYAATGSPTPTTSSSATSRATCSTRPRPQIDHILRFEGAVRSRRHDDPVRPADAGRLEGPVLGGVRRRDAARGRRRHRPHAAPGRRRDARPN